MLDAAMADKWCGVNRPLSAHARSWSLAMSTKISRKANRIPAKLMRWRTARFAVSIVTGFDFKKIDAAADFSFCHSKFVLTF